MCVCVGFTPTRTNILMGEGSFGRGKFRGENFGFQIGAEISPQNFLRSPEQTFA